ncbi:tol-pal system-associated acyl-CoA thioesterase [Salinisphaera hydrothermalis]|uniref:Putative thioesterase n=1 Tax=Salinisphaera hydrothermalis (strain C41B8) TaxID=1304275 RepID=A0A084IKK3_SALHC|nr:tol-pal system-associated acyl-CoA thioesterase [Salinisphaera hydrothermalis]KEZ77237.1 putative thioesterase [Salinisphaera hydrothermalis C41B8]
MSDVPTPFHIGVRVYYEDTDATGVVYHANYLRYFERARTEWLEAQGLGHQSLADAYGIVFTLADLSIRFRRPARLDDRLSVSAAVAERTRARVVFEQEITRDGALLIQGQFTVACVKVADFRPCRLPEALIKESR